MHSSLRYTTLCRVSNKLQATTVGGYQTGTTVGATNHGSPPTRSSSKLSHNPQLAYSLRCLNRWVCFTTKIYCHYTISKFTNPAAEPGRINLHLFTKHIQLATTAIRVPRKLTLRPPPSSGGLLMSQPFLTTSPPPIASHLEQGGTLWNSWNSLNTPVCSAIKYQLWLCTQCTNTGQCMLRALCASLHVRSGKLPAGSD